MASQDPLDAWSRHATQVLAVCIAMTVLFVLAAIILHALWPLTAAAIFAGVYAVTVMGRKYEDGTTDDDTDR